MHEIWRFSSSGAEHAPEKLRSLKKHKIDTAAEFSGSQTLLRTARLFFMLSFFPYRRIIGPGIMLRILPSNTGLFLTPTPPIYSVVH